MPALRRAESCLHIGSRAFACLLLLLVSSLAMARDARMHGANGGGGECPEAAAAAAVAKPAPAAKALPATTGKTRAPTTFRGGSDDTDARTPRWHRFLPGMFR